MAFNTEQIMKTEEGDDATIKIVLLSTENGSVETYLTMQLSDLCL